MLTLPLAIALIAVYLALLIVVAEFWNRSQPHHGEFTRKMVHIGSGQVLLLAWWLQIPGWVGILAGILAAGIALLSYYLPILPSLESVGRRSFGTFFYAISISLLSGFFFPRGQPEFAALGLLIMAWGDGLAALIGQNFGRHPYQLGGIRKSWEGSLTMLVISGAITGLVLGPLWDWQGLILGIAVIIALVATLLETFSKLGIDNLTVPLGSAFLSWGLTQLWL
ncbi:diacylglycerol/polyprenol kinase family protein [Synechocystis sp. LKSZ1]|uniref:diacylglycerol/polyprenol kinase family protein n=1 Tax=Synechocystis sp. LKSZ1 TaxID=3144951 RepID=UPI00336BB346